MTFRINVIVTNIHWSLWFLFLQSSQFLRTKITLHTNSKLFAPSDRTRALRSTEWKIFVRAQACTKTPSSIRESEDLDVLGDLENFTIASTRTPSRPPLEKVKIWMFWGYLENFTLTSTTMYLLCNLLFCFAIVSTRTPLLPPSGKVKIWMCWNIF